MAKELTPAEQARIAELKEQIHITDINNCENEGDFVFISYKREDALQMLEIVHKLQTEFGLRVYYDKSFDINNENWTSQFTSNMDSEYCKGIIIFISNDYYTSYATLMEFMHSQCTQAKIGDVRLPVIPITIRETNNNYENKDRTTGLGVKSFPDGRTNEHWLKELKRFNHDFNELSRVGSLTDKMIGKYEPEARDEPCIYSNPILKRKMCRAIFEVLKPYANVNENFFNDTDIFYKNISATIRSAVAKVGGDVFGQPARPEPPVVKPKPVSEPEPPAKKDTKPTSDKKEAADTQDQGKTKKADTKPHTPGVREYECEKKDFYARYRETVNEKGQPQYTVLKGSRISSDSVNSDLKSKIEELVKANKIVDNVFTEDVAFETYAARGVGFSSSALAVLFYGTSHSGPAFMNKESKQLSGPPPYETAGGETGEPVTDVTSPEPEQPDSAHEAAEDHDGEGLYEYNDSKTNTLFRFKSIPKGNGEYSWILLKGSRIKSIAEDKLNGDKTPKVIVQRKKWEKENGVVGCEILEDIEFNSPSTLANICLLCSINGWEFIKQKNCHLISGTRAARDKDTASGDSASKKDASDSKPKTPAGGDPDPSPAEPEPQSLSDIDDFSPSPLITT